MDKDCKVKAWAILLMNIMVLSALGLTGLTGGNEMGEVIPNLPINEDPFNVKPPKALAELVYWKEDFEGYTPGEPIAPYVTAAVPPAGGPAGTIFPGLDTGAASAHYVDPIGFMAWGDFDINGHMTTNAYAGNWVYKNNTIRLDIELFNLSFGQTVVNVALQNDFGIYHWPDGIYTQIPGITWSLNTWHELFVEFNENNYTYSVWWDGSQYAVGSNMSNLGFDVESLLWCGEAGVDAYIDNAYHWKEGGPVDHIVVTPNPVTIPAGQTIPFTAMAFDQFNNTIPGVNFNWSTNVGFVDSAGVFTAQTTSGIGYVNATNGTVTGTANVTVVAGSIDHIVVDPDPVIVVVGETQQFNATAYDTYNNEIPGVSFDWSTNVGTVDATGFFTAQTIPGIGIVTATNGTVTGLATVNVVAGPIDHIIVTPDPITIIAGGPMPLFTVTAYDMYNNIIPGVTCNWTSNVWNETGDYILPPGEAGWINFTCGNCSYNVTVNIIYGPIDYIVVTPNPVFMIVGETQQFTATAYDVYNNVIPGIGFVWTTDVGSVNSTGFFTAQSTPATGTVTATNGTVSGSANVTIVDAIFDINLREGWNLISLPLAQYDESIDRVLMSIEGKWNIIRAYDAMNDTWLSNCTFKPDSLNTLKTMNHKMGYWINITESNVTLTVGGSIPISTSINLYAGWNLVGYPSLTNETVANALWGTGADKVEKFDAIAPYRISEVEPSYVMKPGEGYWVHVVADTVWVIDW